MPITERPRLLMLTHRYPYPPNRGDRIRSYNLLRVLSDHYRVTLGCTTDEPVDPVDLDHVEQLCESVIVEPLKRLRRLGHAARCLAQGKSLTEGMFHSPALLRQIEFRQQQQPYDVALVFCSSMFPYLRGPAFCDTRMVVDLVDVDSHKWQQMSRESFFLKRPMYRLESMRVKQLEHQIVHRADAVALVSDREADLFRETVSPAGRSSAICGISNGVDTNYFQPLDGSVTTAKIKLVFTGVLDYSPNVEGMIWFCRQVLPALPAEVDIELAIVGRRPHARVLELDALPNVEVVGEVPDVRPYFQAADIAISPLHLARGIQNKVLEAMACGLPVVVSPQSAEGIDARSGEQFLIADTVEQWREAILGLARDPAERARLGRAARELVESEYSWTGKLGGFVSLLQNA